MLLFCKLVDETQMSTPPERTRHHDSRKLSILLAVTDLVPKPIWSPEFFGPREIWAPEIWSLRNLVPKKLVP